jgi:fengycin family lipopeptide synthetase D
VQKINGEVDFKLEYVEKSQGEIDNFAAKFVRPFDLSKAPLMRVGVIKVRENSHILMFDLHHIISDGVSMGILIKEFIHLYLGKSLEPLKIQYKDYAEWQNKMLFTENIKKQEEYWLNRFAGEIPMLDLPVDYPRPAIQQFDGDKISFDLSSETIDGLKKIANETNSTMYMVLLSVYNIMLHKYTDKEDIVIGSPIAGRVHEDLKDVIGVFINTLAIRNFIDRNKEFKEFLLEVNRITLEAYENQSYQIEELVSKLQIPVNASQNPLFTTMFVAENVDLAETEFEGFSFKNYNGLKTSSKVDMTLYSIQAEDRFTFKLEYCTRLFKKETITEFSNTFIKIAQAVSKNSNIKIKDIVILDENKQKEVASAIKNIKETISIDVDF